MKKTILVTGATDGIGLLTAEKLVDLGHHVLIHGRNPEKLKTVEERLRHIGAGTVEGVTADFANISEVEQLASKIQSNHARIDVVINNAGIYKTEMPITSDGLDIRFVVNTIAPYFLTKRLLSLMNQQGRIVNLSSAAQAPVDLDALEGKYHLNDQMSAYAQSKLGITMWTRYLATTLGSSAPIIMAVNPGSLLASKMVKEGFGVEGKDLSIGADILIRASLSDEFLDASGKYYDNDLGAFSDPHPHALNLNNCDELVKVLEHILSSDDTVQ